jgi:hypothetical protein
MNDYQKVIDKFINKNKFVDAEITGRTTYLSLENIKKILSIQKKHLTSYPIAFRVVSKKIRNDKDMRDAYIATISLTFFDEFRKYKPNVSLSDSELLQISENAANKFLDSILK